MSRQELQKRLDALKFSLEMLTLEADAQRTARRNTWNGLRHCRRQIRELKREARQEAQHHA